VYAALCMPENPRMYQDSAKYHSTVWWKYHCGESRCHGSDVIVYSSFLLWPGVSHCITCPIVHTICNLACSHEADPQTILSVFIICQGILVSVLTFQ